MYKSRQDPNRTLCLPSCNKCTCTCQSSAGHRGIDISIGKSGKSCHSRVGIPIWSQLCNLFCQLICHLELLFSKSQGRCVTEVHCNVQESIRGCDVFLIQPTCPPVNDSLMELLIMIDACKRASARSITAVMPYFGYARADRKTQGRESIAAKLTANLLTEAGMLLLHASSGPLAFSLCCFSVVTNVLLIKLVASPELCCAISRLHASSEHVHLAPSCWLRACYTLYLLHFIPTVRIL